MSTIPLPWSKPPLTGNRTRGNVYARANEVKQAKADAQRFIRCSDAGPVIGANVTLHYLPRTKQRRDADGLFPTLKVCLDALVAEGILPDDSWVHVPSATCRIHTPDGAYVGARLWLELIDPDGDSDD
jgi:hypothetical protein